MAIPSFDALFNPVLKAMKSLVLHSSIRLSKTDGTSFVAPQRLKSQRAQRVAAARHAPFYTSIEE